MESVLLPPTGTPKKRSFDGRLVHRTPHDSAAAHDSPVRDALPAPSTIGSNLSELTSSVEQSHTSNSTEPKAKKRELTFAEKATEKATKAAEKAARERSKAEEKDRREVEKRVRDEEKRKKEVARRERELEKERKQQLKEADQKAKDDEKARREEAKQKKERSQMRIGAFFARPAPASTPPSTPDDVSSGISSRRSSLASIDIEKPLVTSRSSPTKNTDYEKLFPSFYVFENTVLAPYNRFTNCRSNPQAEGKAGSLPWNSHDLAVVPVDKKQIRNLLTRNKKMIRPQRFHPVRQLLSNHNAISEVATDLNSYQSSSTPLQLLEKLPVKYLAFFHTDFDLNTRPPYRGTYTRIVSPECANKLSKNPTYRGLPDTNYDYDSEVEWEPPQEGDEDINLEDEESEDEAEDEEMDDFLDDVDDVTKRRAVLREMEAVSSGICWQESSFDSHGINMYGYKMDVLDDAHHFPIDPYATHYWAKIEKDTTPRASKSSLHIMQPPRIPLSNVNGPNLLQPTGLPPVLRPDPGSTGSENVLHAGASKSGKSANKSLKMIPDEMLPAFKTEVEGSDLTKVGLIEVLKKRFPKASKDSIKDTLSVIALREGSKGQEKKWKLL